MYASCYLLGDIQRESADQFPPASAVENGPHLAATGPIQEWKEVARTLKRTYHRNTATPGDNELSRPPVLSLQPIARIVEPQERPEAALRELQLQVLDSPGRSPVIREDQRQLDYEARVPYL